MPAIVAQSSTACKVFAHFLLQAHVTSSCGHVHVKRLAERMGVEEAHMLGLQAQRANMFFRGDVH